MKKIGVLLGIVLLLGISNNSYAKDRRISNGFSVNLVTGVPMKTYGSPVDATSEMRYRTLWGLQLGNRWYFAPQENMGFGLMVNWFDFTMALRSGDDSYYGEWGRATLDISFLEIGPVGSFAISENAAVDAYYNLRPTLLTTGFVVPDYNNGDGTYAAAGLGLTHALGAAFRIKVFNIGVEYVLGGINSDESYDGTLTGIDGTVNNKANSVRILIGVKF